MSEWPPVSELRAVAVVVPVHDEEELLERCLASLDVAVAQLVAVRPGLRTVVVVALDRCTDGSAAIAARHPVVVLESCASGVGAVGGAGTTRRTGVEVARAHLAGLPAAQVWVAGTDADSEVPPGWLVQQVEAAGLGAELVVGRVRPDPRDLHPTLEAAWQDRHRSSVVDAHVHGANLGVRLDAYDRAGGFLADGAHEDVDLVRALRAAGVLTHRGTDVLTSGRLVGRVADGFAGYLRALETSQLAILDERRLPG